MNRLPVEILLKIEEFRKEAFINRIRCFEDEHGYCLKYNYVKNINIHMRYYWVLCLKSMNGIGVHNDGLYGSITDDEIGSEIGGIPEDSESEYSDGSYYDFLEMEIDDDGFLK